MFIKETRVLFYGDADMPLIADIIHKYEAQNNAAKVVDKSNYASNRDDIFLKVEPRGDPIGGDTVGLGNGSIWKARPIKLQAPAKVVSNEELQQRKMSLQEEVEALRKENQELKSKLEQINYA